MKNRKLFGISPAILFEDLKLYWFLPTLVFVFYSLSNILEMIGENRSAYSITNTLNVCDFPSMVLMLAFPFIISLVVLSYYHIPTKALLGSALPISRSKFFNTQVLSGFLMYTLPVILITVLYIILMPYVTLENGEPIYALNAVLKWFFVTESTITFFYGMFIFLGTITGNIVLHIILCVVGFFVLPGLSLIISTYVELFYHNYAGVTGTFLDFLLYRTNPYFGMIHGYELNNIKACICYLLVGILLILVSKVLIMLAKLEKSGDGFIFKLMEEITTIIACIVGMSIGGVVLMFIAGSDSVKYMVIGMVLGFILAFFLTKLVIRRTAKVFDKPGLKSIIICLIACLLFSCFSIFDIGGYAKRVPDVDNIKAVKVSGLIKSMDYPDSYDYSYIFNDDGAIFTEDKNVISKIQELHKYVVDNKLYLEDLSEATYYTYPNTSKPIEEGIYIEYVLSSGKKFVRSIDFKVDNTAVKLLEDITNMEEYKKGLKTTFNISDIENINIERNDTTETDLGNGQIRIDLLTTSCDLQKNLHNEYIKKIIAAIDQDSGEQSYLETYALRRDEKSYNENYYLITILSNERFDYYTIHSCDKNTLAVIAEVFNDDNLAKSITSEYWEETK